MLLLANIAYQSSRGQQKIMVIRDVCPQCKSPQFKKNGHIHNGKQNHHCHDCGCQFVQCCEQYLISEEKRGLIEGLLVERISLSVLMMPFVDVNVPSVVTLISSVILETVV